MRFNNFRTGNYTVSSASVIRAPDTGFGPPRAMPKPWPVLGVGVPQLLLINGGGGCDGWLSGGAGG